MVQINVGNWLRAEYAEKNKVAIIKDEGKILPKEETGFEFNSLTLELVFPSGEIKQWTVNFTSQKNLAAKWGKETKQWTGKKIALHTEDVFVKGIKKKSIIATPFYEPVKEETVSNEGW